MHALSTQQDFFIIGPITINETYDPLTCMSWVQLRFDMAGRSGSREEEER